MRKRMVPRPKKESLQTALHALNSGEREASHELQRTVISTAQDAKSWDSASAVSTGHVLHGIGYRSEYRMQVCLGGCSCVVQNAQEPGNMKSRIPRSSRKLTRTAKRADAGPVAPPGALPMHLTKDEKHKTNALKVVKKFRKRAGMGSGVTGQ
jgi:hypothetical protein